MFVLEKSKSSSLVESALAGRELRQKLISGNLANVDTPFYKARDIRFEEVLKERANEIYNVSESKKLNLAKTNEAHMAAVDFPRSDMAQIFLRDGHMARNDANTVDLDVETTEMGKNTVMINALDGAYKAQSNIFKSVIDASAKN